MKLTTLIFGTSLVASLAGCASVMPQVALGCYTKGDIRSCTDYVEGGKQRAVTSFYKGTVNGNLICGMRGLYEDRWLSIADQGCDGIADMYQEGNDKGVTNQLKRADDENRFKQEFDLMLQKAKEAVWKE